MTTLNILPVFAASAFWVTCGGFSIGNRLALEIKYNSEYRDLPVTAKAARELGWTICEHCRPGLGHQASNNESLHLWYDQHGDVMGFGASTKRGVESPWRWDEKLARWQIDFLFRDGKSACEDGPTAVPGSIGDRLTLLGDNGAVAMPVTLGRAFDAKFNDGGPCFPYMGWHMMYNAFSVSSPTPVYGGDSRGSRVIAMNLNSYDTQKTPSFEANAPKEGDSVFGWHVYFDDHKDACKGAKQTATVKGGFSIVTDPHLARHDFANLCTPYFGRLWTMIPTTVVDLTPEDVCGPESKCKYVHYAGPAMSAGFATPCSLPRKTDSCHPYHQVNYGGDCTILATSNLTTSVDVGGAFGEDGVLEACRDKVVSTSVVCWRSDQEGNLNKCECPRGQVLV